MVAFISTHFPSNTIILFIYMDVNTPLLICVPLVPFADDYLGWCHSLAVSNDSTINVDIQVSLGMLLFSVLMNCPYQFPWCMH